MLLVIQTYLLSKLKPNIDPIPRISEETPSQVAPTILSTQSGETRIESEFNEMTYIHPRVRMIKVKYIATLFYFQPFHVPRLGLSILNVKNNRNNDWLALRSAAKIILVILNTVHFL